MHLRLTKAPFLFALLLLFPVQVFASDDTPVEGFPDLEIFSQGPSAAQPVIAPPLGSTQCFDYYTFGSVTADVTGSLSSVVSGTPVSFKATLKNTNPYPVVDAALYVKIFKKNDTSGAKQINGNNVVDAFFVKDGISLQAGETKVIDFSWNVPAYVISGDYYVATFVNVAHAFNLLGLTFTDDVVGNIFNFKVQGELSTGTFFDKDRVTVGGRPFHFAAYPPKFGIGTHDVPVVAHLQNTGTSVQEVTVTWKLYSWDALSESHLISETSQVVTVPPKSSAPANFTVSDTAYPVYYLVGTAQYKDVSSIIGVRFVRDGVDRVRLNFPAVTKYPFDGNSGTTLFSCLHSIGTSDAVKNTKLVLSIRDSLGIPRFSRTFSGYVTGEMMAYATAYKPWFGGLASFTLAADLYQNGTLVDSATLHYDCKQLAPELCSSQSMSLLIEGAALIALILMVIVFLVVTHSRRKPDVGVTPNQ